MRKITAITIALFLTLALAGCAKTGNTAKRDQSREADRPAANTGIINENTSQSSAPTKGNQAADSPASSSAENPSSSSTENPAPAQSAGNSAPDQVAESTGIVAKSGNIISSSDKEALLNNVDKELDALLNDVNNLEDIKDSDLN